MPTFIGPHLSLADLPKEEFKRKTFGRIFVQHNDARDRVKRLIEELDPFEAEYMPDDLIAVWNYGDDGEILAQDLVYLGKFEFDVNNLIIECLKKNLWIWCINGVTPNGNAQWV